MPQVVSGTSYIPGFVLWAVVGLLCSQIARLPGKGWLTVGFLLLSVRSLLYIVSSGQPSSDDPAMMFGPWLVVGAVGCCLIGVVVGGAGQVAGTASLPGVGGWWAGLPWFGKAAIGLAVAGPVVGVLLVAAAMLHDESVRQKYRNHYMEEDDLPSVHKSDIEPPPPTPVPVDPNGADKGPPMPEADAAARHNEASSLEMKADEQFQAGNKFAAKDAYWQAAQIQSKLADDFSDNPNYRYEAGVDFRHAGDLEADVGTNDAAMNAYSQAQSRLEKLVADYSGREGYVKALIAVYDGQAKAFDAAGRKDDSDAAMNKAAKLRESLPKDPDAKDTDKP